MPPRIPLPSPAMGVALAALFVSLGGVGYAAATGSIDSREIKNDSIRSKDVRDGGLTGRDIADGRLTGRDVANGRLSGRDIAANSLTGDDIVEPSLGKVPSATRADGAAQADRAASIAANTVDSARVVDGSLRGDDVGRAAGTGAVDPAEIPANECLEVVATTQPGADLRDDAVLVTMESSLPPNLSVTEENSTTPGLVRLNFCNPTNAGINPPSLAFHWVAFDVD